ncbi:MAG: imidazoleglycerol-phosphate dehydratase HisB [Phycisphaerales bacterium]
MTQARRATITRETNETSVSCTLDLDSGGAARIETGLGFLDHMLDAVARHARIGLDLRVQGDLQVDDHHSVEDAAIVLGQAFDAALGDRSGIERFGSAYAPLDESLARVVVDFSGRAASAIDLGLSRERLGDVACENLAHLFESFASNARCALHVDVIRGTNDHHRAESAFKAFALAIRKAIAVVPGDVGVPSTKGVLR